jgi:hypothetical protein
MMRIPVTNMEAANHDLADMLLLLCDAVEIVLWL